MAKKNTEIIPKIITPFGTIAAMSRCLGVTRDTISDALSGYTHSTIATIIRNVAIEFFNGVEARTK